MTMVESILRPIERGDGRRTAVEVYEVLQSAILNGLLKPGTIVSQVQLARALNVSRTPVREAMRMLQEGGLLIGEPNYRSRVVGFDPSDIEALYMKRLVLESLGVAITTRRMNAKLLAELREVVETLESETSHSDFAHWQALHRRFHQLIVAESGGLSAPNSSNSNCAASDISPPTKVSTRWGGGNAARQNTVLCSKPSQPEMQRDRANSPPGILRVPRLSCWLPSRPSSMRRGCAIRWPMPPRGHRPFDLSLLSLPGRVLSQSR